jgi:lipopolysaccharide biosynthesis protein
LNAWWYLKDRGEWGNYTSPFFDSRYYYEASQDVRDVGLEPISHYLDHGWRELRSPSRHFDAEGFCESHPYLNGQQLDLAETCLRLYGSYAWKVDGKVVPTVAANDPMVAKAFSVRERRRLFDVWQRYRGFFDADFYLKEYPEAASTPDDAFMHYMHQGYSEDRKPRGDFDAYRYRKKYGLSRGQNPFRHCVDRIADGEVFPSSAGDRLVLQAGLFEKLQGTNEALLPGQAETANQLTLCIHLHCFYVDLLHEVVDRLRPMALPFSLVVTVCNEVDAAAARKLLDGLGRHREIQVLVVRNRGRDVAPFLVDASSIWRNSDLVLHLHTKRSLHISWGDNWRRYLFDRTIGEEQLLVWAIDYFQRHPRTGMIYPENYCMIRHFTEKEENSDAIHSVARKLGLGCDFSALGAYPAGSMAFYRVSALTDIVDNDGLENLFEEEEGQLDGTAAHAFERLLPESVRQKGSEVTPYFAG